MLLLEKVPLYPFFHDNGMTTAKGRCKPGRSSAAPGDMLIDPVLVGEIRA